MIIQRLRQRGQLIKAEKWDKLKVLNNQILHEIQREDGPKLLDKL